MLSPGTGPGLRSPETRPVGAFGPLPVNRKSVFGLGLDRALQASVQDEDLALCPAPPSEGMGWPGSRHPSLLTRGGGDSLAMPPSSRTVVGRELHSPFSQCPACLQSPKLGTLIYSWGHSPEEKQCHLAHDLDLREDQALHWRGGPTALSRVDQNLFSLGRGGGQDGCSPPSCPSMPGVRWTEVLGGGDWGWAGRSRSARPGYTPGCGPGPALASAHRKRPAVCSTPPRPSCSLAGSWPEERHWRRDLKAKETRG